MLSVYMCVLVRQIDHNVPAMFVIILHIHTHTLYTVDSVHIYSTPFPLAHLCVCVLAIIFGYVCVYYETQVV